MLDFRRGSECEDKGLEGLIKEASSGQVLVNGSN
jgi:hypothetical protein